jgi:methylglutaconyl-CoA hydratase
MSYTDITVHTTGPVATVIISREAHRNALRTTTIDELTQCFTSLKQEASIRSIILRGSGTRAFCAGADLSELLNKNDPNDRRAFFGTIATLITTMRECPKPIISTVHGYALAGGLGLVAASDIVIATPDAVFGLPEVKIGLGPLVVMEPLSRLISRRILSRLILTGERISASEALAAGLISEIADSSAIDARGLEYANIISKNAPEAVQQTKLSLQSLPGTTIEELADTSALRSLSKEAAEGIAAFNEKRTPTWSTR